jgi:thiol-disulfide isomerase/thioredoxin
MNKIVPGQQVPDFSVGLADGSIWRLSENAPDYMLMIDIYRGYHCPRCRQHLEAINAAMADFNKARMDVIAVSADSAERVAKSYAEWDIGNVVVGGGLSIADADRLGLYLSHSIEIRPLESPVFAEPAVLFVRSDLTLYGAILQTFPFARPKIPDLLEVPTFAAAQNYPPRGDYVLSGM